MAFRGEVPLRGWKEILPILGRGNCPSGCVDKRTAKSILSRKNLLRYENGRPVLLASEYFATLKR